MLQCQASALPDYMIKSTEVNGRSNARTYGQASRPPCFRIGFVIQELRSSAGGNRDKSTSFSSLLSGSGRNDWAVHIQLGDTGRG